MTEVHFRREEGKVVHVAKDTSNTEARELVDPEEVAQGAMHLLGAAPTNAC